MNPRPASGLLRLALVLPLGAAPQAAAQGMCSDWIDPHASVVEVGPESDLARAVSGAASGTTVLLKPGTYRIASTVQFLKDDVTLRGKTGKAADVILDGNGGGSPPAVSAFIAEAVAVSASRVALADLTIRHARHHAIHAYPPTSRDIAGLRLRNLRVEDCGQQLIKVNSSGGSAARWVDSGLVECSWVGFVDNSFMEPQAGGFYTGGIDIHGGRGWVIRGNLFKNIQREGGTMEHAVHLWSKSRGALIENNRFEDVFRAIGLGMKTAPSGPERRYPDGRGDAPYFDFLEGMVRNNWVCNRAGIRLETGIELMNVDGVEACHNTVFSADRPFSSIEYRWPNTRVILKNNLVGHSIMRRDEATAELAGNVENAGPALFQSPAQGNLHLSSAAGSALDKGVPLGPGKAETDIDGDARDDRPDVGADEYRPLSGVKPGAGRADEELAPGRGPRGAGLVIRENPGGESHAGFRLDGRWLGRLIP